MWATILHHSIAILNSERAQITDPRVRKLADGIIAAQENRQDKGVDQGSECQCEMKWMCMQQ
jgi:uncharacterized protein (DUF305 family)